ncbi:MAG: hypothetical protein ACYTHM_21845 [Planctomycetota bacterium]|jgi:hypothetical protein
MKAPRGEFEEELGETLRRIADSAPRGPASEKVFARLRSRGRRRALRVTAGVLGLVMAVCGFLFWVRDRHSGPETPNPGSNSVASEGEGETPKPGGGGRQMKALQRPDPQRPSERRISILRYIGERPERRSPELSSGRAEGGRRKREDLKGGEAGSPETGIAEFTQLSVAEIRREIESRHGGIGMRIH